MKLKKTLDGIIYIENSKLKSKDRDSIQCELTDSALDHWEENGESN